MLSRKFTKSLKLVQNLFTNKVNVLQPPEELNYFDIMPVDILIMIFNNLELTDVMKCESISQQTREAAASYYRCKFNTFRLNFYSLVSIAQCNQYQDRELFFAKVMFRVIGPYVQQLFIDYPTLCVEWVRPVSKMVRKYCRNLTSAQIAGIPDHRIKMVCTTYITDMAIYDCSFGKQFPAMTSSKLLQLYYRSDGSTTDMVQLIREHPNIRKLLVEINYIPTVSLGFHIFQVYQTDNIKEMQKSIDFSVFLKDLGAMSRLTHVELILPFYMRLSHKIVNTSVESLRRKCAVHLTTVVNYLEPEHIDSLRTDFDGLNGIHCYIKLGQYDLLTQLLTCLRLEVLRLTLICDQYEDHDQFIGVALHALIEGARIESCHLHVVVFDATHTRRVGIKHLPAIVEFLQNAKHLEKLNVRHCTAGLIKRKAMLQTEKVVVIFT